MNGTEFLGQFERDPRLAPHANSALPAWLWSADGARIVWANAAGAAVFGASDAAELAAKKFGPADPHRRQVARLASRLPAHGAIRMERMRGFGAAPGALMTCGCSRLDDPDGGRGVLVVAAEPASRMFARAQPGSTAPAQPQAAPVTPPPVSPRPPAPDPEAPVPTGEAPAAFALFDALEDDSEPAASAAPEEPDLQSVLQLDLPHVAASREPSHAETLFPPQGADAPANIRRHPLRFVWQTDADGRFVLGEGEFTELIGPQTAAAFGRPWHDIARDLALDPQGRIAQVLAGRETWVGIDLDWPVDGGQVPVELSGLPAFDRERNFLGYRGFGICRDPDRLMQLAAQRRHEFTGTAFTPQPLSADIVQAGPAGDLAPADEDASASAPIELQAALLPEDSPQTDLDAPVDTPSEPQAESVAEPPKNVLPFRPIGEARPLALTPVENSAFNELARQLSARLDTDNGAAAPEAAERAHEAAPEPAEPVMASEPAADTPEWLAPPEPPARGTARRDKALLDLIPIGILIYRLDRLVYANAAFLKRIGYESLHALEEAGGLDALYVEPGVSTASSTSEAGTPVTISASHAGENGVPSEATDARLYTISWDDDSALALICSGEIVETAAVASARAETTPAPAGAPPSAVGHADAEELAAILDTCTEGIVIFDGEGNINSANRSAEALFGYDADALAVRNLADLFAPESRHGIFEYLAGVKSQGASSLLEHGRDALGRVQSGGIIPLSITMGRTRPDGPNFFAVFRDLSQSRKSESELLQARRLTDRAASAKADMLARISHEVRTPLNAIIGFAEVMIGERFGKLGNERYVEYLKDIRASGERVISVINDLLDLSRIETGKLELTFTNQNLNELVESCVAVMQPQANRERIIIRTSLAHSLPPVVADARALRQIALNLIGNSIHLANAGGQVIVSTALSDFGEVMLRLRDTGQGMNENEVAAALEPFRTPPPADQAPDRAGVSLSLTKALVEANRAQFHIKPGPHSGTLIEVVFSRAVARA
ncbi:PAS domain S-box protein [Bradyrhizobium lablabi]|uniref:PAS domain S-box protein n=1 Tax=Bradyrhizobium lablabi TaxID=722472 RepID=UPI001BAAD40D|nr:PAS domain-containing protein [Bradyrhizobium lablabi]MBR1125981.1 PAS domain S-box protein [Bradyrhizobium lablabi]